MASVNLYSSSLSSSRLQGRYTGLHRVCPFMGREHLTYLGYDNLGDVLSYPNGNGGPDKFVNQSPAIELQPDAIDFGTLSAETTPTNGSFFADNDEYDLDRPTEGFASIPEAIEDIRQGKLVIVVDDEDRENEGDIIMAASKATPEAMAFIVKHGTGIVCVSMKAEDLERLELPLMVTHKENEEKLCTAFTVSVVHN
ncbi:GTP CYCLOHYDROLASE II-RELATED [Salix purpurea]|uniref:3,4-dihydroxy-2-butanone-4-phosphate synthase n=1 Tax=Salix purpurea TaxID=77065 RepID=A0A9Q0V2F2_SALPP|nr:GTP CYCLOHYDROLASE II-RELATED [Salix purpurea]